MKILKTIAIILGAFIAIGFFLPGTVRIEHEADIAAPATKLFAETNDLKNWDHWSAWANDPKTIYTYSQPTTAGDGAFYAWDSKNPKLGIGRLTILNTTPNALIHYRTDFGGVFTSTSDFKFTPIDSTHTHVYWSFVSDLGINPLVRWAGLSFSPMLTPQYAQGLQNLKKVCEAKR